MYNQNVDHLNTDYLRESLAAMRKSIADAVAGLPTHQEFINEHCKVQPA
jgi:tryptophan halogenase